MIPYDPRRPDVVADPYPALGRLREEDPVHWSAILGGWVLTRYADVRTSLADPRLSADRITPFLARQASTAGESIQALLRDVGLWVVFNDPPVHTRLRNALGRAFTARAIETRRARITAIVDALLDRAAAAGEMDLIRDFAYPLPVAVIGDLLGVPTGDHEQLKAWSDDLAGFIGTPRGAPTSTSGRARSRGDARLLPARRRPPPGGAGRDLVTALLAAGERGEGLSESEFIASCVLLLFAGHETTTNLIGNGALALLQHPGQAKAWRESWAGGVGRGGAAPRRRAHAGHGARGPRGPQDRRPGDRRGDRLFLMINAANRDPAQFAEPDQLDLGRADNRHLAFGHGIHFCLGAPLARLEGQLALPRCWPASPPCAHEETRRNGSTRSCSVECDHCPSRWDEAARGHRRAPMPRIS